MHNGVDLMISYSTLSVLAFAHCTRDVYWEQENGSLKLSITFSMRKATSRFNHSHHTMPSAQIQWQSSPKASCWKVIEEGCCLGEQPQIFTSHVVILGHLAFVQMSRISSFAFSGRIKVQEAVAVMWLMAAKMIMLALSVRLWLARHDALNNVCRTDFPQKLFENQNEPWYIQRHQDHSSWYEIHPVWPGYTSSANIGMIPPHYVTPHGQPA